MHIPDGLLDGKTLVVTATAAGGCVGAALRRAQRSLDVRHVPRVAVTTAFIFAAQMVNFPVAGGTSGHLIGGALAAVAFGPWMASLMLTIVLTVQALIFADGGIIALGANVLNMAVLAPFAAYGVYSLIRRVARGRSGDLAGAFAGGLVSVILAAAFAATELAASGVVPLRIVMPPMLLWHCLIGLAEGTITAATVAYLIKERPGLIPEAAANEN